MVDPSRPLNRRQALLRAALIGVAVIWLTGAIPRWSQWYSPQPYYRAQVHALFEGRLALGHAPEGLALDLAWVDGGVQQVWGLGVPLWQSLWEAIGRVIHWTPFPDRLAMLFGIVLVMYALLRAWSGPGGDRSVASRGAFLITALLPGVLTMLRGRIDVYEEAAAYAYGAAMLLLAGAIGMIRRPSTPHYLALVGFAGMTGLVRPTAWFYGLATAVVATALYVRYRGSLRRAAAPIAVASGLFLAGAGALYATNALRFGDGAEFGHRLNLENLPGNMYATRFGYPFEHAPTGAAARDVLGGMFGRPEEAVRRERYDRGIHAGQSEIPRWREYYFTTYTWPYLPLAVTGLVLGGVAWARIRRRKDPDARGPDLDRDSRWLAIWAVLGGAPLVVFYLHSPSVSSRYFLDLGPAIAVLLAIAWCHAARALGRFRLAGVALAGLAVWWAVSVTGWKIRRSWWPPVGAGAAAAAVARVTDPLPGVWSLPAGAYDLDDPWLAGYLGGQSTCRCFAGAGRAEACDHAGLPPGTDVELVAGDQPRVIEHRVDPPPVCTMAAPPVACSIDEPDPRPRDGVPGPDDGPVVESQLALPVLYGNGTGWDVTTGAIGVSTYLFVDDPAYLEVEVAPLDRRSPIAGGGDPEGLAGGAGGLPPGIDRHGRDAGPDFAPRVRARVELEELPLVATASTARGVRLRFAGPRTARYRRGLQVIFVAFGPPDRIDQPVSEYTLLRVAWRDHREGEP
jgi:hypothetical protein